MLERLGRRAGSVRRICEPLEVGRYRGACGRGWRIHSDSDVFRDFQRFPFGGAREGRAMVLLRRCCGLGTSELYVRSVDAGVGQTNGTVEQTGFQTFRGLGAGASERDVAAWTRMNWL